MLSSHSSLSKPQIITHASTSLTYTPYSVTWIPQTPSLTVTGQSPTATGVMETYTLSSSSLTLTATHTRPAAIKCSTYGTGELVYGDFDGLVGVADGSRDKWSAKAHKGIVNCVDGVTAPCEIVTGGRDGCVKVGRLILRVQVWDQRVPDAVANIVPKEDSVDVWGVAFGNSYGQGERCIAAGYENGDVKLFDLKAMKLLWETNVKNGVKETYFL